MTGTRINTCLRVPTSQGQGLDQGEYKIQSDELVYKKYTATKENFTVKDLNVHYDAKTDTMYKADFKATWSITNNTTSHDLLSSDTFQSYHQSIGVQTFLMTDPFVRRRYDGKIVRKYLPHDDYTLTVEVLKPIKKTTALLRFPDAGEVRLILSRVNEPEIVSYISFHGEYAIEERNEKTIKYNYKNF